MSQPLEACVVSVSRLEMSDSITLASLRPADEEKDNFLGFFYIFNFEVQGREPAVTHRMRQLFLLTSAGRNQHA